MRPQSGDQGEIDIVEVLGTSAATAPEANIVWQTVHDSCGGPNAPQQFPYPVPAGDISTLFSTYAVGWGPGVLRWYVDGVRTYTRDLASTPWLDDALDRSYFLRHNLAVAGLWPGNPDPSTRLPAEFVVDWVRVSQR